MLEKLKHLETESLKRRIPIINSIKSEILFNKIKELKPKKILELGTANGYSGCILGSQGGELTTIEIDAKIAEEARINFEKFNINAKIIVGDGVKEIKNFPDEYFDLVFIDFAKRKYLEILEDCIRVAKNNNFIIADNVDFDKCKDFKQAISTHKNLKTEIINGLSISQKHRKWNFLALEKNKVFSKS